jgi:hypothetical protein
MGQALRYVRVLSLVILVSLVPAATQGCGSGGDSDEVAATPDTSPTGPSGGSGGGTTQPCCRVCTQGKACGDTCINVSFTCHVGPGCACNA